MSKLIIYRSRGINLSHFKATPRISSRVKSVIFHINFFKNLGSKFRLTKSRMEELDTSSLNNLYKVKNTGRHDLFLLSLLSFEKFLNQDHETYISIIDTNEVQEIFKQNFKNLKRIWIENHPSTIIYVGGDVIAVKEFAFPLSENMGLRLIGHASASKSHISRAGDRPSVVSGDPNFSEYFNAEVKILGPAMTEKTWEVGESWLNNWCDFWEYEQDLWNAMFREDFLLNQTPKEPQIPIIGNEYNFQLPINEVENVEKLLEINEISLDAANLVHLHSSRDQEMALDFALQLLQK